MQNEIRLPFDGMAKNTPEVAQMISDILKTGDVKKVDIIVPTQWGWNSINVLHPVGGVLKILKEDSGITENYQLACFASCGEIGVTATPC